MKVYLDDVRDTPDGWVRAYWPSEVISMLQKREVTHLSLDFDLGDAETADHEGRAEKTGYTVMLWLEEQVFNDPNFPVPHITFHSDNGPGLKKMKESLDKILRLKALFFIES